MNLLSTIPFVVLVFMTTISLVATATACEAGSIDVAGSLPIERLAEAWKEMYEEECTSSNIMIQDGGSSSRGASSVCGSREPLVDVGGMTRNWNSQEATTVDGWRYDCSRTTRSIIQIEVAVEGVAAAINAGSLVDDCIQDYLGGGLTLDQLRWIYSNYDETELESWGWNSAEALPYSDNNPNTHKWSELSEECPDEEILIGGPPEGGPEWDLFLATVFQGNDETIDLQRPNSFFFQNMTHSEEDRASILSDFVLSNPTAISYFGIVTILQELDLNSLTLLKHVDNDVVVEPSGISFQDGSFPLSRRLYMNFNDDDESLRKTRSLLEFGLFSEEADELVKSVGFWPITEHDKIVMATRLQTASGVSLEDVENECGPTDGVITIAGSSTVFPVADLWADIYRIGCPTIAVEVEGGGSSAGAGRVCANEDKGSPVMIGDMSRQWKVPSEATNSNLEFVYECQKGDIERSAIQIDVAIDGLTVAVKEGGVAWDCIQILGGLTVDQLRWIYSNYNDKKLEETGWDPSSLKNTDNDSRTHRWIEIDERCANSEIRIAGADDASGTYEYFLEAVLSDHDEGETFDLARPLKYVNSEEDDVLVEYLENNDEAISYFGYAYYFDNQEVLSSVPIQNSDGEMVKPITETIGDGSYNPLARRIFMNLLNDDEALIHTLPFIRFGLNHPELVAATGYVAVPSEDIEEFLVERIEPAPHDLTGNTEDDDDSNLGAIVGGAVGGVVVIGVLIAYFVCCRGSNSGDVK